MTPEQREVAERLVADQSSSNLEWSRQVVALLRELLVEPQGEPVAWQLLGSDSFLSAAAKMHHGARAAAYDVPLYAHPPQQLKPLTRSMQAEIECGCLVAWNASTYGHSKQDTVHPMFLSAFILGYWAAERAHGITGAPT